MESQLQQSWRHTKNQRTRASTTRKWSKKGDDDAPDESEPIWKYETNIKGQLFQGLAYFFGEYKWVSSRMNLIEHLAKKWSIP